MALRLGLAFCLAAAVLAPASAYTSSDSATRPPLAASVDPPVVCPANVEAAITGDEVRVPIVLTAYTGMIETLSLDFLFDETFLTYQAVECGSFTGSWTYWSVGTFAPNVVRIAGITNVPQTPAVPETLAVVVLSVAPAAIGTASTLTTNFGGDLAGAPDCAGVIVFLPPISIERTEWGRIKAIYR